MTRINFNLHYAHTKKNKKTLLLEDALPLAAWGFKNYHKRCFSPLFKKAFLNASVLVLTGPRQVGKSTFLLKELPLDTKYLSLDDFDTFSQATHDPEMLLNHSGLTVIDEVQRAPHLLLSIKKIVDKDSQRKFILSGSANLLLMSQVSESLAGRAVFFEIGPLSLGELKEKKYVPVIQQLLNNQLIINKKIYKSHSKLEDLVFKGGMPVILHQKEQESLLRWRDSYIQTYLERDLKQLRQIENLADFRRLMTSAALRCGQILNTSELGRDIGLSQPTVHRYLNLLEISLLMNRLCAYSVNKGLSLVKNSKIMWLDSGLVSHLAGYYCSADLLKSREWGNILECYVYSQIKTQMSLLTPKAHIFYWRTRKGEEIDFIIEQGQRRIAIEVKAATKIRYEDTLKLQLFLKYYPDTIKGVIIYNGTQIQKISDKIIALPLEIF